MLFARAASRLGAAVLRPRAAVAPPLLRAPALAAPPLTMGPIVHMSLWKSPTVQEWVEAQAKERPDDFLPRPWTTPGYKRTGMCGPRLSRRRQSLMVKQAIKAGEIKLEPTRMPDVYAKPYGIFKGHMRQRNRPTTQAEIAARMMEMPKLIAEYKAERLAKRRQARKDAYFKAFK